MKSNRYDVSAINLASTFLVGLAGAVVMHRFGVSQKWQVALLAMTLAPFWYIAGVFRARWALPSFWVALALYLSAHLAVVWLIFQKILSDAFHIAIFAAIPIAMVETLVVAMALDGLERKLRKQFAHLFGRRRS